MAGVFLSAGLVAGGAPSVLASPARGTAGCAQVVLYGVKGSVAALAAIDGGLFTGVSYQTSRDDGVSALSSLVTA